jgi:ATP-dependent Lon protease
MLTQTVTSLDQKVLEHFADRQAVIHKGVSPCSEQFRKLPRYVAEFLCSRYIEASRPAEGIRKINHLLAEYYVEASEKELIKSRIRERSQYRLFGQVRARFEPSQDAYWAEVPALGDRHVRIANDIIACHGPALLTSGVWGTLVVRYDPRFTINRKSYPFCIVEFVPQQITHIDLDAWVQARHDFTSDEWIDVVTTTVGFNPDKIDLQAKMLYLYRLVPLVEPNVNLVELGPPESGKTYTYQSLSNYSHVVSGSNTTVASLFYNQLRHRIGILGRFDCVLFDEIAHADMRREMMDVVNMLKDYMGSSKFSRDDTEFASECSVILSGNIDTDRKSRAVRGNYRHLFQPLPPMIRDDRAFLDRIHGYVPGWQAPQITPANYADSYGWMADYFSEVMHRLRSRNYIHIVRDRADFNGMSQRSSAAIGRIASGLLKLVFPHRDADTVQPDEMDWVLSHAVSLRQRVLDQLAIVAPGEFAGDKLQYKLRF